MAKDLTTSAIDRQNILNNPMALPKIREALDVSFVEYKGTFYVTKQMAAKFYEVDERTVTNCLNANDEELRRNGYKLLQGEELKEFKQCFGQEMDFPTKTTIQGIMDNGIRYLHYVKSYDKEIAPIYAKGRNHRHGSGNV